MTRQVPPPSADAWLFDLWNLGGPAVLVLRVEEEAARDRLTEHLVELGVAANPEEARRQLASVPVSHAGVVW